MIVSAPENNPAEPMPAIARPMMSTAEVGATAQTRLPTSKMARKIRYVHCESQPFLPDETQIVARTLRLKYP
jgi:hypothetical protein